MGHQITRYQLSDRRGALQSPLKLAVVSDLHNGPFDDILPALQGVEAILCPGDLLNRHRDGTAQVARFLAEVPAIAPTFVSLGNHEYRSGCLDALHQLLGQSKAVLLDGQTVRLREDVVLGGLSSAAETRAVDASAVSRLRRAKGYRVLLCHHPEYYAPHVAGHDIDLTVSGHAHGGQVQLFGRGLYAPGQGLFPRLTHGLYFDGRLLVSRGMTNSAGVPRLNNPCELLLVEVGGSY